MKKALIGAGILLLLITVWLGWNILGPATGFDRASRMLYIPSVQPSRAGVIDSLTKNQMISSPGIFDWLAARLGYWSQVKPGRYEVRKGMSALGILRMLRNGSQSQVRIVINKIRTREEIAAYLGRQMETDSAEIIRFFNSPDSTRMFGLDTNNIITAIIPNTYLMYWTTPASKMIRRLFGERETFWNKERLLELERSGLTKESAYILASIVEEESNKNDEKPVIASVYLNRIKNNMSLSADPTVKFALRNFGLKRITLKHIRESASSPYNTYSHKGLPPGPICTPSIKTIDAVISPAKTDYLFFCARPDFSGYHSFASNETDHFKNARAYQRALDSLFIK